MKRCPECRRDYYDETLSFCLADGTELVYGLSDDEPESAILSEPGAVATGFPASESPTRAQIHTTDQTTILPHGAEAEPQDQLKEASERQSLSAHRAAKPQGEFGSKRRLLAGVGVVVLILIGGYFAYKYFSPTKPIDSIAVMPFVNESGNPDVEYLSDGMTDTLINRLMQLPNLNVKARSSVFRYKGKDTDAATIGTELNVQAILNGRVVQRGDGLTLYLELVDAQTGNQIWGDQYNRKQTDLISLQSEIARDVSLKLKTKLSGSDAQKLAKNYTENAEAYQLYLKGRFHWYKRNEKDFQRSAEYFRQAIALDPDYALAYAGLADIHAPTGGPFKQNPALRFEQLAKAREAALKAISLDDNLAEAHTALGTVLASADYDFAGAEREYRRAIDLNPNYADAHFWYGMILNRLGRWEESFAEFRRALELEPFNLVFQALYGASLAWAGRYEEAINHLEKTRELDENFFPTLGNLTTAYQLKGDYDRTTELRARELELSGFAQDAATLRNVYAKGGWEGYLRYVTGDSRPAWVPFYEMGLAHVGLGERDKAIVALNKSYENREGPSQRLKVDPRLDPLRDDPRFQELLRKIGFPE